MSTPEKPMLAFVQWIGGEYNDSYTAGVPVDWIRDFDPSTFDSTDNYTAYAIEWRESVKNKGKPKKGWKCFDARVIKISRSLNSLEKQLGKLEGLISPLRPERTLEAIRNNFKNPVKRTLNEDFIDGNAEQPEITESEKGKKKKTADKRDKFNDQPRDVNVNNRNNPGPAEIRVVNVDLISNVQIHRDNQLIKRTLNDLVAEVRNIRESQAEIIQHQVGNHNPQQDPNAQVEIGHAGSNVFVGRNQWETANSRNTFQSMGVSLVNALFEDDVLLRSNFKGGMSKINKNAPRRPGLDSNIINAIKEAVKQKFPAEFKQSLFGMAINNMLTEKRRKTQIAADIEDQEEAN